jgi:hypothetical protein
MRVDFMPPGQRPSGSTIGNVLLSSIIEQSPLSVQPGLRNSGVDCGRTTTVDDCNSPLMSLLVHAIYRTAYKIQLNVYELQATKEDTAADLHLPRRPDIHEQEERSPDFVKLVI